MPTIELEDEDYDDDAEVEVLNASEKLEVLCVDISIMHVLEVVAWTCKSLELFQALKQRTYKIVEAKGLHFTPAPESE